MADDNDDRELGIEFGGLDDDLDQLDYPVTNRELVERFGDQTLGTPGGEVTVRETLDGLSDTSYESPEEVHEAVLNMVGHEAVGRQRYSDRGVDVDDESGGNGDQESF